MQLSGGNRIEARVCVLGTCEEGGRRTPVQGSRRCRGWKALELSRISPLASYLIMDYMAPMGFMSHPLSRDAKVPQKRKRGLRANKYEAYSKR